MMPTVEIAASNAPSSNGSDSASATRHSSPSPSASARARPASSNSGGRSVATTVAPVRAAGSEALPEPAAMSITRSPGPIPAAATTRGPSSGMTTSATSG